MTTVNGGIERYLLDEMLPDEREKFEDRLFTDDELFYKVADAENELVDRYVNGDMSGDESARFETSLERVPSRREKVANANALQRYIKDTAHTRPLTNREQRGPSFFGSPAFAYAASALLVVVTIAAVGLLVANRRQAAVVDRLQSELSNSNAGSYSEAELQRQLAASQQRESEMRSQVDNERGVSGDLTADLDAERATRSRLEREIAALRNQRPDAPKPLPVTADPPTIATVILKPIGARGPGGEISHLNLDSSVKRISILLALPSNIGADERLSVELNGKTIAQGVRVAVDRSGASRLSVSVQKKDLTPGENHISVMNMSGKIVGEFRVALS